MSDDGQSIELEVEEEAEAATKPRSREEQQTQARARDRRRRRARRRGGGRGERGGAHRAHQDGCSPHLLRARGVRPLARPRGQPYASKKEGATNIAVPLDSLRHPLAARYYDDARRSALDVVLAGGSADAAWFGAPPGTTDDPSAPRPSRATTVSSSTSATTTAFASRSPPASGGCSPRPTSPSSSVARTAPLALPEPVPVRRGLEHLRVLLGRNEIEWALIVAWMISALRAHTPCPALHLLGEQGSGKSVLAKALISLIDPGSPLGRPPGNEERLQNARLRQPRVWIDNLTHLQPWLSDGLCAIITGERERRRKLYTDATPFYLEIQARRCSLPESASRERAQICSSACSRSSSTRSRPRIVARRTAIVGELEDARGEHFAGLSMRRPRSSATSRAHPAPAEPPAHGRLRSRAARARRGEHARRRRLRVLRRRFPIVARV